MTAWIFQGNPDKYDIDGYLAGHQLVYWAVNQHALEILVGDIVYLWRAKGTQNAKAGIVAKGSISETPTSRLSVKYPDQLGDQFWITQSKESTSLTCGISTIDTRLTPEKGMLSRDILALDSRIAEHRILKHPQGTNFRLSETEYHAVEELWNSYAESEAIMYPADGFVVEEGRLLYKIHLLRERDRSIVNLAKQQFVKQHGSLYCELCRFSSGKFYGSEFKDLVEVHHIKPIATMKSGDRTEVNDLMILCANCHRAIHHGNPHNNLRTLTARFKDSHTHS